MNDRKLHVLLTAQRLFIDKGYVTTSIQDIIEAAQISKGTFYNYFSSKNECLMAIFEFAHEEAIVRRRELMHGKDKRDKNILAEQILVRMHVNREHNLLSIYEAVFYSGDNELRSFVRKRHLMELKWLTTRLTDVYGEEAEPYVLDCAVMILGVIQHLIHFLSSATEAIAIDDLVHFTIRRVDAIMEDMIRNEDTLLGNNYLAALTIAAETPISRTDLLVEKLQKFLVRVEKEELFDAIQMTQFLLDEMNKTNSNLVVIEALIPTFQKLFKGTRLYYRSTEIATLLLQYIDIEKGTVPPTK
ncbi:MULTISPECIES: TetR/AcrR family transcriptional regulator [Sporosarcina]|uniref:TetR/AcrR family transcriptional regulator n=1 Tax=Sporosarcina saromensis TaxID=359365 RepID=A0ABU4GAL7_9BACL|nr:TetR/AcrR family transcriptional regulator [Sporosarcina saromensis]MDW0114001.1 TetR/AcrR family transcriptional regulator [Sporosarcina saromensis]